MKSTPSVLLFRRFCITFTETRKIRTHIATLSHAAQNEKKNPLKQRCAYIIVYHTVLYRPGLE